TASTNAYDFETGTLKRFSSDVLQTFNYQWSPNLDFIGVDVSHTVRIIEIDTGIEQNITPRGQRQYFIAWSQTGDAVYVYTNRTIERYTLASGEWDVLLADTTISKRPILSPDGTQFAFLSNDKPYVLHIPTKNTTALITNEMDEIEWVGWSPDSAWILLREGVASADGNRYYLAKPDASLITVLAETINAIPTWSSDGRWVSYGMNDEMGKTAYSEVFLQHIADNIPAERVMRYTHTPVWSPYGYDLAFIQYPQLQRLAYLSQTGEVRLLTAENVHVMGFEFLK
ncbi:MAG: PD40 domain-containing protein, partial [Anaerolineae bacterium]|nr:PD40 domain-containing protein [Anaerolineae bacterium]